MPGSIPAAAVNSAKEYRDRAERLRHEAEAARDPGIKEQLFQLARRFEELAASVEITARNLSGG